MTVKTDMSRFHIHDELTAPEGSVKILKGIQTAGASISKFIGALAGSAPALRAYARMRSELRGGVLPDQTRERIALAVAEYRSDAYSIAHHGRSALASGLGLDEISKARNFSSGDEREDALLTLLGTLLRGEGRPKTHLVEEAREIGWSDEQILEAIAQLALCEYESLVSNAAALPLDQTDPTVLPAAA